MVRWRRGAGIAVSDSGPASASHGGIAVSGVVNGPMVVDARPAARSAYRLQVQRIAPPDLLGRERELQELADFCTAPDSAGYLWLRAGPWAGKSALMAWFALHPPGGVRIVSFFITARFAGQSDRVAFTDVVIEQLAELLGEPVPGYVTDATRDHCFLDMLNRTALACRNAGERLILLVDGLDEDSGVTAGPDAHSIAALLPAVPPFGARVVVAGRPNPPIPADVPPGHPLRDPSIVTTLTSSSAAEVVRHDMVRELTKLLKGTPAEQDMLGLLVAAGGGLGAADLAELLDAPHWEVEDQLTTVAGRSFTPRLNRWEPHGPPVYVLGHEELQATAVERFGAARLDGYRQTLHAWADRYRERGWPLGTPEYLLRGYYRMLQATDDLPRLLRCATDEVRHDRMLDVTGGDTDALVEITRAQDRCLRDANRDLLPIARLTVHRDRLVERNANLPVGLPAVWAILGHMPRAEALARSMPAPDREARAHLTVAYALAGSGDEDRAARFVTNAEAATRRITDEQLRAELLIDVTSMSIRVGDIDRAERLALAVADPARRAERLAAVAEWTAEYHDREAARAFAHTAEDMARSIHDVDTRPAALAAVARAMAACGDPVRARLIAASISDTAGSISDPSSRASAWAAAAVAHAHAGDGDAAVRLLDVMSAAAFVGDLDRAEALARAASNLAAWARELADLAAMAADDGDHERALTLAERLEALTPSIDYPAERITATANAITTMVQAGGAGRAAVVAERTVPALLSAPPVRDIALWLPRLAGAIAETGRVDLALALVRPADGADDSRGVVSREAVNVPWWAQAQAAVALAVAREGDLDRAEQLVQAITPENWRRAVLGDLVLVMCARDPDRAVGLAEHLTGAEDRAIAYTELARVAAGSGDQLRARTLAARAEALARNIRDPDKHLQALAALAGVARQRDELLAATRHAADVVRDLAGATRHAPTETLIKVFTRLGEMAQADALRRSLPNEPSRQQALTGAVAACAAACEAGDVTRAEQLLASISDPHQVSRARSALAKALARTGSLVAAADMAGSIANPSLQAQALVAVADGFAVAGDIGRAQAGIEQATTPYWTAWVLTKLATAAVENADDRAARMWAGRAASSTAAITDPYWRVCAMAEVAKVLITVGERAHAQTLIDRAQDTVSGVHDPNQRLRASVAVLDAIASQGDLERFRALAPRAGQLAAINDSYARSRGLALLARAAVQIGDLEHAESLLDTIDDPGNREPALVALVQAVAARDGPDAAEAKAVLAGDHKAQARTLAAAAATAGPDVAGPLVARALRCGHWTLVVDILAQIQPSAVDAIADEYLRVRGATTPGLSDLRGN